MYSTTRISAAFALAALVHEKQKRKSTDIPYISHPMAVAAQVSVWGGSEDQFIAALLHDVVEDGGAQYMPVIEEHFGKHVLDLVMACSDAAPQRGQPKGAWIERKEKYIANLRSAADEVLLISAADKWHNLASILADAKQLGEVVFDRFIRQDFERTDKKKMVLWYYKELLAVYRERNVPVVVELENLLSEIENVTGQKR
ncbi:MAG TPA: HD domain-containing protein [Candidatus Duodenibacillus intestinavium]|nr:HD domain-containing protein [Candidatus Duodenibacillus intestinavium]